MASDTETGFKGGSPTPRTDVGAILQETRQALKQLKTANCSQSQMPLHLVGWSVIMVSIIAILQSLAAMFDILSSGYYLRVPELGIFIGTALLLSGLSMLPERNQNSGLAKIILLLICIATSICALIFNGVMSIVFLPPTLVVYHIMLSPYRALWLSIGTILLMIPIGGYFFDSESYRLLVRFIIGAIITLVIMQTLMRYISRTNHVSMTVTDNLSKLALQLDEELLQSNQARETATITDPATGLLNGFGFESAIGQALANQRYGRRCYVLNINFQRLEEFNTILSTNERGFIMKCLTSRLRGIVGADALIARTGRDEFAVLLPHADAEDRLMMRNIEIMQDVLRRPLISASNTLLPSPAIGVAVWPDDSEDVSVQLGHSQIALQNACSVKLTQPVRYNKHMQDEYIDRKSLSSDIAAAIDMDEFEIYFQPILDLQTRRLHMAEALIRWNHPTRGFLIPANFIPLAEASGQIIAITDWILDHVLVLLRNWRDKLYPDLQISINMPSTYLEYCVENEEKILARLMALQIPSRAVILEITEGSLLNMTPKMLRIIAILESIGFQLAMDDFGMGYSNLSQLERLPISFLKIDKSFVNGIEGSMQKLAICRAIIRIGHELGIRVVAEGIENISQEKLLYESDCDFGQGYLFAKPMPAEDFTSYIVEQAPQRFLL